MSRLAHWLVREAVTRLPEEDRERWHEEWAADLNTLRNRPLTELGLALRVAWYAPTVGKAMREGRGTPGSDRSRADRDRDAARRRYQLRQQAGRFLALTPIAVALAFVAGVLLQAVDAPEWCFYVFAIALSAGTTMQVLIRGAGVPRPGAARGVSIDLEIPAHPGRTADARRYQAESA